MSPVSISRSVTSRSTSRVDAGLHLVDEALHPEAHQAPCGCGLRVAGIGIVVPTSRVGTPGRASSAARRSSAPRGGQDGVTETDELGPLVAQVEQDPLDVRKGLVRLVDAVEAGHPPILGTYDAGHANREPDGTRSAPRRAFEVAARARALEATGPLGHPPRDRRARLRHAGQRPRGGQARARRRVRRTTRRSPGIPALREAIAADVAARKGVPVEADHVFVTVGGKGVMFYAILALIEPGDEVIVPDPGYPIYESITRFVGGTPVPIPIRQENDFRLDLDELAVAGHAADPDARPQLAGEPDRRRPDPRRPRADRRAGPRARPRRSSPTRSTAGSCTTARARLDRLAARAWPSGRSSSTASPRRSR